VTIDDESYGPDAREPVPGLAGVTATTHVAFCAHALADAWRKQGANVILGGIHPAVLRRKPSGSALSPMPHPKRRSRSELAAR